MEVSQAETLALYHMEKHGLIEKGWSFKFDNAIKRFGVCRQRVKVIGLSRKIVALNEKEEVLDTILHEIAHALVGMGHGHDRVWKLKCVEIGCRPVRCYSSNKVNTPEARYIAVCGGCGIRHKRNKRPDSRKRACNCQSGRSWDNRVLLTYVDTRK